MLSITRDNLDEMMALITGAHVLYRVVDDDLIEVHFYPQSLEYCLVLSDDEQEWIQASSIEEMRVKYRLLRARGWSVNR